MNSATTNPAATKASTILVRNVRDRDHVRFGVKHEGKALLGQHAEIVRGVSIRLFGTKCDLYVLNEKGERVVGSKDYDLTFKLGDEAEYDSFNMHYTGTIIAIGEKTVTIQERGSRAHRLSIFEFCWRNWDLNLEAIADRNLDVMMNT